MESIGFHWIPGRCVWHSKVLGLLGVWGCSSDGLLVSPDPSGSPTVSVLSAKDVSSSNVVALLARKGDMDTSGPPLGARAVLIWVARSHAGVVTSVEGVRDLVAPWSPTEKMLVADLSAIVTVWFKTST